MGDWSQTQPTLLRRLRQSGPRSLSSLARDLGLSEGIVAGQLAELERSGLVTACGTLFAATLAPAAPPAQPFSPSADQTTVRKEGTLGAAPPALPCRGEALAPKYRNVACLLIPIPRCLQRFVVTLRVAR